jgi:conjugal transfer pilus assembly protein TraW
VKYSVVLSLVVMLSVSLFSGASFAVDLGNVSHTFPVVEEGFVAMIKRKLGNVDIEKERIKMERIARDRIENPQAVDGITPARSTRIFYYDPTYTLEEDAVLPCGKVLYTAGTKVNPLDHMVLDRRMIFVDARVKTEVEWLKEQILDAEKREDKDITKDTIEDRIILVGGSVFKLKDEIELLGPEHREKVYFDQAGELTSKFGIKATPAVALQEGRFLKIEEISLEEKS